MFARITSKVGKRGLVAGGLATVALMAVVALLAVTLLPSTGRTAHASGTGGCFAISGPVCTFKNQTADARFESSNGCVVTDTFAEGFDNLVRPGHNATQTAFVSIVQFDACSGTLLDEAFSQDFTGTVQFGKGLTTAAVVGTATMFDDLTSTTFSVSINLTWQGISPINHFITVSHARAISFIFMSHFNGSTRGAEASGTISDGTTNFAASPTLQATISDASGGNIQLVKA